MPRRAPAPTRCWRTSRCSIRTSTGCARRNSQDRWRDAGCAAPDVAALDTAAVAHLDCACPPRPVDCPQVRPLRSRISRARAAPLGRSTNTAPPGSHMQAAGRVFDSTQRVRLRSAAVAHLDCACPPRPVDCPQVRPLRSRISRARLRRRWVAVQTRLLRALTCGPPAGYSTRRNECVSGPRGGCGHVRAGENRVCTASQITGETRFPERLTWPHSTRLL